MTQKEVIEYLADNLNKSKAEVRRMLIQLSAAFTKVLDRDQSFRLPGLGTFQTRIRKERRFHHPQKRQLMMSPPKRVVSFKASQNLKKEFQNKGQ